MAEYSRLASGHAVSTGGNTLVVCPFIPDFIEITNPTRMSAGTGVSRAWWEKDMGQGAAALTTLTAYATTPAVTADVDSFVSSAGFSTIQAGQLLQYGPTVLLGGSGGITKASSAQVTTTSAHGLVSGNVVVFQNLYQSTTTGMPQIAGIPFTVTVTGSTTFTIPFNTNQSNFTAITAGGLNTLASFKQVLYPYIYAPNDGFISAISTGTTTTITTTTANNFVVGQEVAFRIPSSWGTVELNSLPNVLTPGSPVYGFVTSVTDYHTFVVNINSSAYTAFNSNQPVASVAGQQFPQVVPVGDNNSGSLLSGFSSPSFYRGYSTSQVSTINGPAVSGAFCNATFQGFIIGSAVSGTASDDLYWRAYLHDVNT